MYVQCVLVRMCVCLIACLSICLSVCRLCAYIHVCVNASVILWLTLQKGLYRQDSPLHMLITSYQLVSIN